MRIGRGAWLVLFSALVAGSLVSDVSSAQPGKERREDAKERREDRREDAKERREDRREDAKERREDRREDRRDRRRTARRAFLDKWGPIHKRAPVRAELAIHARRSARLAYMKELAVAAGKTELAKKIDDLIAKEQARHDKRLELLKSEKGGEQ